jgi:hypothetical protein
MPTSSTRAAADAGHAAQQQGGAGLAGDVTRLDGGSDLAVQVEGFGGLRQFLVLEHATAMQPDLAAVSVFFVSNAFMLKSIWFSVSIFATRVMTA